MSEIRIQDVSKRFGDTVAVNNVSTTISEGKIITLLGPSGCGKTTLLRCVAGLETPTTGTITVGNETVADPARQVEVPTEERNMGMVFQSYAVWPHMTVYENVAYPLKVDGDTDGMEEAVTDILELVGIADQAEKVPPQLSGGQQQRVAFARAVVYDPEVLLLDEPLSNLDAKLRETMRFELRELQRALGITTLYVTHNQSEAMVLSDELIVMNEGEFVQKGDPVEVYNNPKSEFVADFIGDTNMIDAVVQSSQVGRSTVRIKRTDKELVIETHANMNLGQEILLSIRPEDFHLTSDTVSNQNELTGQVTDRTFFGKYLEVKLDIGYENPITTSLRNYELNIGDRVSVGINLSRIHVFSESSTETPEGVKQTSEEV